MKQKTLSEYPCNYEKKTCRCVEIQNRTCLVHEFKHDCTTVLSTTPIGNHASTYAQKKNVSQKWTTKICVDWHYHSHVLALFLFCALFFFAKHMLSSSGNVYWFMNICHALFIFLPFFFVPDSCSSFRLYLHAHNFSMLVNFFECIINKLLLATTTGKQCSTILLLTWTNMLPTWHFLYYWNNRAAVLFNLRARAGNFFVILVLTML